MMACIAGHELGMNMVEVTTGLAMVEGKLTIYGKVVVAQINKAGYKIEWGTCNATEATVTIVAPDGRKSTTETFTMEMARKAGLASKDNWVKYPESQLRYKALGRCVTFFCPEVLFGCYIKEEIDDGKVIDAEFSESKSLITCMRCSMKLGKHTPITPEQAATTKEETGKYELCDVCLAEFRKGKQPQEPVQTSPIDQSESKVEEVAQDDTEENNDLPEAAQAADANFDEDIKEMGSEVSDKEQPTADNQEIAIQPHHADGKVSMTDVLREYGRTTKEAGSIGELNSIQEYANLDARIIGNGSLKKMVDGLIKTRMDELNTNPSNPAPATELNKE